MFTWGEGTDGRLGHGSECDEFTPRKIIFLLEHEVVNTCCGTAHTLALTANGAVFSWGQGKYGQLGHGKNMSIMQPKMITTFPRWRHHREGSDPVYFQRRLIAFSCGARHSCAADSTGRVFSWGVNTYAQCGKPRSKPILVPVQVKSVITPVVSISCGRDFTAVVTRTGALYTWGRGQHGELGRGSSETAGVVARVANDLLLQNVTCGPYHVCAVAKNGKGKS